MAVGYLLLCTDLLYMIKNIQNIPEPPRRFLNLRRQADAAHRDRLHIMADEGLGVEESLEKHLSRCHGDLRVITKALH